MILFSSICTPSDSPCASALLSIQGENLQIRLSLCPKNFKQKQDCSSPYAKGG
jgi:hypothetical protein